MSTSLISPSPSFQGSSSFGEWTPTTSLKELTQTSFMERFQNWIRIPLTERFCNWVSGGYQGLKSRVNIYLKERKDKAYDADTAKFKAFFDKRADEDRQAAKFFYSRCHASTGLSSYYPQ